MPGPVFVPSTAAPTHMGRFRSGSPERALDYTPPGRPFLPDVFPNAWGSLEAAFGGDPDGDPDTWVWTDITEGYVLWDPGIVTTIAPSASARRIVASSLTAALRNDQPNGGDWTLGNALSSLWPNVAENTPIRSRGGIGNVVSDRFFGYLTSVPPTRDAGGKNTVSLTAHGASRRIRQGKSTPFSAMRKSLERAFPRAYWPLEKGAGGTVGASAVAGVPDMLVTGGTVSFGTADDSLPSSLPLAQFSKDGVAGQLTATIPSLFGAAIFNTKLWRVEFVAKFPKIADGAFISMVDWNVQGSIDRWNITASPAGEGGLFLQYTSASGGAPFVSNVGVDDGEWHHYRIDATQSFGNIVFTVKLDGEQIISDSIVGTNGVVTTVIINFDSDADVGVPSLGHLAVWDRTSNAEDTFDAFRGHAGETVAQRMTRLSAEAGVILEIVGDADDLMGPQRAGAYLDVLQDAIDVDGGMLVDGLGPGLHYFTRQYAYSRAATLTLDSAAGDFLGPLLGQHTDQDRVNRYIARDPLTNADRTYERTDGELGSDRVGVYESGDDFRVNGVDQLDQIAAWKTGLGTVPGLSWPTVTVQLAKADSAAKALPWLEARPMHRVDALGITTGNRPDRRLLLRGWTERRNSRLWDLTLGFDPYDPYAVTTLAPDGGGDDEFIGWLEVDTVTTRDPLSAGGTSVVVEVTGATLTNPGVDTYADDVDGLYVDLDGLRVGVTAISAPSGSTQTLTLNGADVLRAVPAGASVSASDPVLLGL